MDKGVSYQVNFQQLEEARQQEEQEEQRQEQVEVEQLEQLLEAPEREMALESAPGRVLA